MSVITKISKFSLNVLICLFVAVISMQVAGLPICRASDTSVNNVMFIIDASGSMAAQVQGKPKIDVAKDVLSSLIKDLPEATNVGLVAYGHRQKGDCNDVEELAPIAPVNKESLINRISGLHPKGMTPLTFSIQKVAEGLKGKAAETTIILVSDGEETCKGDPCAAVRELKAAGAKFVMHVIGFDVSEKEKKQLNCIAGAGGGSYFTARNAGELKLAAQQAVEKKEPPKSTLTVKAVRNGQPLQARCEIFKTEGEKVSEGLTEKGSKTFTLPPGTYDLKVENTEDTLKPTIAFQGIIIGPGENIEKLAEFSGGTLTVKALRNGISAKASCAIYKADTDQEKGKEKITESAIDGKGKEFKLAPGGYEVTVEDLEDANRPSLTFKGVIVEAGKTVEKVAEFSGGTLIVKALKNGKPFQAFCIVYKTIEDEDKEKEKAAEARIELEGTPFKFTPGAYDVVVVNQEDETRPTVTFQGIEIEPGKTIEKTADFSGGGLKISALRNSKPFSARLFVYKSTQDTDKKKERIVNDYTGVDGKTWKVPPGVYDLTVTNTEDTGSPMLTFPGITVEAGKTIEKTADFSGGGLKISALRNGKPFSARLFIDTAVQGTNKKKERVVNDNTGVEGKTWKIPPGLYDITVQNTEDAGSPVLTFPGITVEAGKTTEKTADFSGGGLKISALRNGKPFSARIFVDTAAVQGTDNKKVRVVNDNTGVEGKTWKIPPGAYDVTVTNTEDAGTPILTFPGITVEAGKTIEKTADFSGGGLKISALRNGKPFSARLFIETAAQDTDKKKQRVVNDSTQVDGKTWKVPPGTYDVTVQDTAGVGIPAATFLGVIVEAGKTTEKTAAFSEGALKISATQNGKPFSASVIVEKAGDTADKKKERIINDNTGMEGRIFNLSPGVYEITVTNQTDPKKPVVKFSEISIEAEKTVEKTAQF
jgi:Ca-activated chloride channel homolog